MGVVWVGSNAAAQSPVLGHVANGSIYRYNIGTREKTVLVANEPCGVTALAVDGRTMYYITSYPQVCTNLLCIGVCHVGKHALCC